MAFEWYFAPDAAAIEAGRIPWGSRHERARRKATAENFQAQVGPVAERYDWSDTRFNRA